VIAAAYNGTNGSALQLQGCSAYTNTVSKVGSGKILTYMSALGSLEEYLDCTGWCGLYPTESYFYKFSNIKDGRPVGFCYV